MNYRFEGVQAMERNISKVQGGGVPERDFMQVLKERLASLLSSRRDA